MKKEEAQISLRGRPAQTGMIAALQGTFGRVVRPVLAMFSSLGLIAVVMAAFSSPAWGALSSASKSFSPASIAAGGTSTLTVSIVNPSGNVSGISFTDTYPTNVKNQAAPTTNGNCGATPTGVLGQSTLSLSGGSISGNKTCTITITVTACVTGTYTNPSFTVTSTSPVGSVSTTAANLTVTGTSSPTNATNSTVSAGPLSVPADGTTTSTITVTLKDSCGNPVLNKAVTLSAGSGSSIISAPSGLSNTSGVVTFTVKDTVAEAVTYTARDTTDGITVTQTATVTFTRITAPTVAKSFSPTTIGTNGTSTLTVTLTNPNAATINNVAFTDTYPANLINASTPSLTSTCVGTATAAGGGASLSLSGGSIAGSSSCTLTVKVTSAVAGSYVNSTGSVTSANANSGTAASATLTVAALLDHILLEHTGSGLTCQPSSVTIKACTDAGCTSLSGSSVTATLSTTAGTWSTNPVTFTGSASVNLSVTAPQTVTIGTSSVSPVPTSGTICLVGATPNCQIVFEDTGFVFSAVPNQVAGVASGNLTVQAVKKAGNSPNCVNVFQNQTVTLDMASQCIDPTTCSAGKQIAITTTSPPATTSIANNPAAGIATYTPATMNFDNASTATFTLAYPDAGKMSLTARYALGGGNYMTGTSNTFVVKPYGFALAATCADGTANGASQSSPSTSDPKFCRAGQNFNATVTAITQAGSATPNYGKESAPETVVATWSRQLPAIGADGILPSASLPFAGSGGVFGLATTSFSWDEVGILKATLTVGDGDYLGAGNVSSTAYVGRFYPDHFDVVITPPPLCSGFVYSGRPGATVVPGQPFTVKATAMNGKATPTATTNYDSTAGFSKSVDLTLTAGGTGVGKIYVDSTQGGTGAIPASKFSGGIGQVNYNDVTGKISYVFDSFPTTATPIALHADDAETVTSPMVAGTDGTTSARSGRLRLLNAYGSELLDIRLPVRAEYYTGTNSWALNSSDNCTVVPSSSIALGNYLAPPAGTAVSATNMGIAHRPGSDMVLTGGSATIVLAKPSPVATGSFDVVLNLGTGIVSPNSCVTGSFAGGTAATLGYLLGNWCGSLYDRAPSARVKLGSSKAPYIYLRERY